MINWVPKKIVDFRIIKSLLDEKNGLKTQMTNYGPIVQELENFIKIKFKIDSDRDVIIVNNGANGMHSLVEGIRLFHKKKIQFATSDFTFPCSVQGPLKCTKIIDIDKKFSPIIKKEFEGLIVTNLFGNCCNLKKFNNLKKIIIYDNATAPYTFFEGKNINNYGDGSIISLHHTKPIGFGEGGIIVLKKEYSEIVRSLLNFGFHTENVNKKWKAEGNNHKMSKISAAFIYTYLKDFEEIVEHNKKLYRYFLENIDKKYIFPNFSSDIPFTSCIPIILSKNSDELVKYFNNNGVEAKKYYQPLIGLKNSKDKYEKIICLPLHKEVSIENIDFYIKSIKKY